MTTTTAAEVMAEKTTFDGFTVQFWTDGSVTTGYLCQYVKGCGVARNPVELAKNVEAARILSGEVSLYDRCELPKAVKVARAAVRQTSETPLQYFRDRMAGKSPVKPKRRPRRGAIRSVRLNPMTGVIMVERW